MTEFDTLLVNQSIEDAEALAQVPEAGRRNVVPQSGQSRSWTTNGMPD